jgi:hypothetical protein
LKSNEPKKLKNLKVHKTSSLNRTHAYLVSEQINGQRDFIKGLEASYSNVYHSRRDYKKIPVQVEAYGGSVVVEWNFLKSFLRKLKGFNVEYTIVQKNKHIAHNTLVLTYAQHWGKPGRGCLELIDKSDYFEGLEHIPVAVAE